MLTNEPTHQQVALEEHLRLVLLALPASNGATDDDDEFNEVGSGSGGYGGGGGMGDDLTIESGSLGGSASLAGSSRGDRGQQQKQPSQPKPGEGNAPIDWSDPTLLK